MRAAAWPTSGQRSLCRCDALLSRTPLAAIHGVLHAYENMWRFACTHMLIQVSTSCCQPSAEEIKLEYSSLDTD